jgi:hypothetical protein
LPWHEPQPPPLLAQVVERRGAAGRALDLGPEIQKRAWDPETATDMPLMPGRTALIGRYWFRCPA